MNITVQWGGIRTFCAVSTLCAVLSLPDAAADEYVKKFDIEPQALAKALMQFSRQADIVVTMTTELAEKKTSRAIQGEMSPDDALKQLLEGTGLVYEVTSSGSMIIRSEEESESLGPSKIDKKDDVEELVVTGSAIIKDPNKLTRQTTTFTRSEIERSGMTRLDDFLGRLPQNVNAPSNVGSGNFLDGQNFGLGKNVYAGSGVNLRGLGSQYTLILIDGRRPAKGGQFGDVVDISNIPLDRVERVEILYDGAAAIYGSDAVGGVINIITNRDYDGTNVNIGYEKTNEGGGSRTNVSIANTLKWQTGSLTSSFSYQGQKGIDGADRDIQFINSLPVPLGNPGNLGFGLDPGIYVNTPLFYVKDLDGDGATTTQTGIDPGFAAALGPFSGPGQQGERIAAGGVFGFTYNGLDFLSAGPFGAFFPDIPNPEDYGYTPIYTVGLPGGLEGTPTIYDFEEGFGLSPSIDLQGGVSLAPKDDTYSVSFALDQDLTESLRFTGTVSYSETEKESGISNGVTLVSLASPDTSIIFPSAPNPFGVTMAFPVITGLPQSKQLVDQYSAGFSGELAWNFSNDWSLTAGAAYSVSDNESISHNVINQSTFQNVASGGERNALLDTDGDGEVDTIANVPSYPSLNIFLPMLGYATEAEYLAAALSPDTMVTSRNKTLDADVRAQGVLVELPAGELYSAFTFGYRSENTHLTNNISGISDQNGALGIPVQSGIQHFDVDQKYDSDTLSLAAEFTVPVVSEEMDLPMIQDFLLNMQVRAEDYSNTSQNGYNWSAGFNWSVSDSFTVRMNRNYSLRVPDGVRFTLEEDYTNTSVIAYDETRQNSLTSLPAQSLIGAVTGLKAERNYGTSLAFIYRPDFIEGLDFKVSLYQSKTIDQIGRPGDNLRFTLSELTDPDFIQGHPLLFEPVIMDGSTSNPVVGIDSRERNTGDTLNKGADLEVNYFKESDIGTWFITLRHNYVHENIVNETSLCNGDECFIGINPTVTPYSGLPVDTVGTLDSRGTFTVQDPLPKHRSSLIAGWSYRGLDVSFDTTFTSDTSIISEKTLIVPNEFDPTTPIVLSTTTERTTSPARGLNMRVGYDFSGDLFDAPEWLEKTRVSLTVVNLYQKEQSISDRTVSSSFDGLVDFEQQANLRNLNPRGRTFAVNLSTTF